MNDLRPIPSCPGYLASPDGRIWSTKYIVGPRPLTSSPDRQGYRQINLSIQGKRIGWRKVHRLIVEAFLGAIPSGLTVNHKDGAKDNNSIENLEIVTRAENSQHAMRTGLWYPPCGKQNKEKTECKHGHPFTVENTYNYTRKDNGHAVRMCRTCGRENAQHNRK